MKYSKLTAYQGPTTSAQTGREAWYPLHECIKSRSSFAPSCKLACEAERHPADLGVFFALTLHHTVTCSDSISSRAMSIVGAGLQVC